VLEVDLVRARALKNLSNPLDIKENNKKKSKYFYPGFKDISYRGGSSVISSGRSYLFVAIVV